jgi:electron transport complex protein RnfG
VKDTISVEPTSLLGNKRNIDIYRAKKNNQVIAVIIEAVTPDGYSGEIKTLVGIDQEDKILGVRVITHKETPGLGDYIEIDKSQWIKNFDLKSLDKISEKKWAVKKDGGDFDYISGATITPRAVIKSTYKCLLYAKENKKRLFTS